MKMGVMIIVRIRAIVEPTRVRRTAWWALPWRRKVWPGIIESAVSSSGAPRNIAGMKSRKVWVIAIDAMKIIAVSGWRIVNAGIERRITAIRLV